MENLNLKWNPLNTNYNEIESVQVYTLVDGLLMLTLYFYEWKHSNGSIDKSSITFFFFLIILSKAD